MAKETRKRGRKKQGSDPALLVRQLREVYAFEVGEHQWPWETERWYELVFSILTAIGEPKVWAADCRQATTSLSELGFLELTTLAKLDPSKKKDLAKPALSTVDAVLRKAGFTAAKSRTAMKAICSAAASLQKNYDGKIQNYLRERGTPLIDQAGKDFGFRFAGAPGALTMWLQNVLSLPVPARNPLADEACKLLDVEYDELVQAATDEDLDVAVLDDILRAVWEQEVAQSATEAG